MPPIKVNEIPENAPAIAEKNTTEVPTEQLEALILQNQTLKTELGQLVGLFQHFTGLLNGKNVASLMFTLPKLINDPGIKEQIDLVLPIIEKYQAN